MSNHFYILGSPKVDSDLSYVSRNHDGCGAQYGVRLRALRPRARQRKFHHGLDQAAVSRASGTFRIPATIAKRKI